MNQSTVTIPIDKVLLKRSKSISLVINAKTLELERDKVYISSDMKTIEMMTSMALTLGIHPDIKKSALSSYGGWLAMKSNGKIKKAKRMKSYTFSSRKKDVVTYYPNRSGSSK